ncbi:Vacuolar protein sorting-associated protein 11 [Coemansia sp. RSA 1813]|nr:Vacuolar protein sorting-associated protein 11 [Coemansia sp. RSA 1646]KAJ1773441.1 Vacuolar protein sorting-associated protein 11 [Coemansia sp. RSA 1843]KAJ2091304.1 Vacuolar protein sorting-associated protein 11 [Coemansia sp. RSA 986]KAJ2216495.1 Vacuolar protein sorting-associated protein 11 [Coemansia sp. RSA 487]KAJ2571422.1 Vacuolar protein sorting-associated protein 11 [Coemansia sp. RSA 1813]
MSNFQLRQFHFFKREALEDLPEAFKQSELLMASNGGGLIFIADATGSIHIVDRSFIVRSFVAIGDVSGTRITQMLHIHQTRTLLTVEENVTAASSRPVIKLWSVDKLLRQTDVQPVNVKYQQPSSTPYPLTAVAATPSISQIALGFAGGHVLLIRGNILKSKSTKQRTLHLAPEPVTNLHFVTDESGLKITLFATTTAQTLVFDTSSGKSDALILEERGCGIGCSLINEINELIVARDEAIYFYNADGRGPCFAFDAPKVLLRRFKHYLLLATAAPSSMAPPALADTAESDSPLLQPADSRVYSYNDATTFTILDTKNKLVAYTGVVAGGVRGVATEWGSVFVLGGHGSLDFFSEKDLLEKLDILYRQNLYPLAIKMAQNGNYDLGSVAGIYKKYGDWLYSKDDFDTSMSQYMQTIGYVEPSYVIRKYLDAQRLGNLASYLQELHTAGMATSDHTTLLLNCYTKLRDEDRLNQFIHTQEDYQFDVDTAISVCRQAGFYDQALYLADKFSKAGMYLKLKVEDQEDIKAALEYMRKMADTDISTYLAEFGRRCLASLPRETTELLVDVCIKGMDARAKNLASESEGEASNALRGGNMHILSMRRIQHLFADQPTWLAAFLERVISRRWQIGQHDARQAEDGAQDKLLSEEEESDMKSAWNTLLELYLCGVESPLHELSQSEAKKQTPKERALGLLRSSNSNLDWDRAYILCASNGFAEGVAALYEQNGDVGSLLDLYIESDDVSSIRRLLNAHGEQHPDLHVKTLHYFARNPQLADSEQLLSECLATIEKHNLMSPLRVLQALGGSERSGVTLGMVRGYIMRQLEATTARISDNEKSVSAYADEYKLHHSKMEALRTKPIVFQSTKCTSCMTPLDLPSIHFLCKHSYHQRCLGDVSDSCPRCQMENQMLEDQRRHQEINARKHSVFFDRLHNANDGFDVVAEWFSKNPFAFTKLVDQ